jgi:hypothetical protein
VGTPLIALDRPNLFTRGIRLRPSPVLSLLILASMGACVTAPAPATTTDSVVWHRMSIERPPMPLPGSPSPDYPAGRVTNGKRGRVVMHLEVDSAGRVDSATARVVTSDDPAFSAAVRAILPLIRYEPARMVTVECAMSGGQPVMENRAPKCRDVPGSVGRPVRAQVRQQYDFAP